MKLQYVFGNPTGPKKRSKKVAKKRKNPKKVSVRAYKTTTVTKKKRKKKTTGKASITVPTKAEITRAKKLVLSAKATLQDLQLKKKMVKGKTAKNKIQKLITAARSKMNRLDGIVKAKQGQYRNAMEALNMEIKKARAEGSKISRTVTKTGGAKKKGKKKVAKKKKTTRKKTKKKSTRRKTKKRATKKKVTRKKRKTKKRTTKKKVTRKKRKTKKKATRKKTTSKKRKTRKKSTRKKTTRKKTTRRRKRKTKTVKSRAIKKGYTLKSNPKKKRRGRRKKNPFGGVIMKKNNPMSVAGFKVAGYDPMELAELATGGLFYGAANSYISPMFAKIPGLGGMAGMLGGTVPSLMAGIAANMVSDKIGNKQAKQALEFIGDGLLGAAVVGLGVHLSQTILPPAMSGVDYIPGGGVDSDFNGVDYTPEMGGVDFTPGASLPGANMNADFGQYEESVADFGQVPEGLS